MDIHFPCAAPNASLPVIVTIHGGDWIDGDRSYFDYLENPCNIFFDGKLSKEGYIHVNMNYSLISLSNGVTLKTMLSDINCVLNFVSNISRTDMDRICLWGHSAGGHLAMMYAFNSTYNCPGNNNSSVSMTFTPSCLITEGGPYNLSRHGTSWLSNGVAMGDVKNRYGSYPQDKWDSNIRSMHYFEEKMGKNIYTVCEQDTFIPGDI